MVLQPFTHNLSIGDIVWIIGGAFKGEVGILRLVDEIREIVTLELYNAQIPLSMEMESKYVSLR